jgi:alpha-N-arabinofuranosidase
LSATDYAKKAKQWAHGLRLVDPTIKLVACGNQVGSSIETAGWEADGAWSTQGNSEWDREVLQELIHVVDYHSIHF